MNVIAPFRIEIPEAFHELWTPTPGAGKIYLGGRLGAKSHSFARVLLARMYARKTRALCVREIQASIRESVHYLLKMTISDLRLDPYFTVTENEIKSFRGSEAIFKGLHRNVNEIKSTEAVDVCWIEEGQSVSAESLRVLLPTIRKPGSETWISYNPLLEDAPVHRMAMNPPPGWIVRRVSWRDNPYFPPEMHSQRIFMQETDPILYEHVWEGECLKIADAVIFKGHFKVEAFETPDDALLHHGVDFGFADDPGCLIRCFQTEQADGRHLWVDQEAYDYHVELDDLYALYDRVKTSRKWPIFADNSRPETISYIGRQGFNIMPATKWQGSVEDGIAYLKSYRMIHIHPRCVNTAREAALYSYKVDSKQIDPRTNNPLVLPVVVDKHNHAWDAIRYSLDGYITNTSDLGIWRKLGRD